MAPALLRGLPAHYRHYEAPLTLAYLIATRSGIRMEEIGPARLESLLINVADVFEEYVRVVLVEATDRLGCAVLNGNAREVALFPDERPSFGVKPDYYFKRGKVVLAVADAKYKGSISKDDRYEVLAHTEATKARLAIFICPAFAGEPTRERLGRTPSGREFYVLRVNLNAADAAAEETRLIADVADLLHAADAARLADETAA